LPNIEAIVAQHAEEAAFLWLLRDAAVSHARSSLASLVDLDGRVEAHIDGLRIAGGPGWEICKKALGSGEPGEVFTAAVLAFEAGDEGRIQDVLEVGTTEPGSVRGLVSALGWLSYEQASRHIKALLGSESTVHRRVGLAASAVHRKNPGAALPEAFASADPLLKARALRAAGELGVIDLHITARANLKAKDPPRRYWAAWSTALLNGHIDAVGCLQSIAEVGGPFGERSATMAMRRLPSRDAKVWLKRLVKDLSQMRIAVVAAGAMGDPEVIPFLIDQMKVPKVARVAGESFSLITGVHVAYDELEGQKPEGYEAGPIEEPEDENVAMDPDESLPWPDPALVQKWWNSRQGHFAKGTRYLLGRPIEKDSLRQVLKMGYQRQRAAAALELAILQPGRPLFEVRAPGPRQRQLLA
jgi:uncharacterized protein (TIGR02270 family)